METGDLTKRALFRAPVKATDANGKRIIEYADRFKFWTNVRHLRGGESVMQSRLASKSPAILTVRAATETRQITSEWRVVVNGGLFNLKEDPRETQDGAFLEVLVERIE